ncbi:MAG TPA: PQQ-binding-like beta-propeller repeat protein [Verrucomicrobiae bacterium]|nr:PQQ-binding-like beta-propeller repeat protein [Verrucomicrobiae bacterium]
MKIQCSCGAKYAIDVTPGMPPVKFVCQACGQDYSAYINELIRKETEAQPVAAAPQAASPAPQPAAAAPVEPPPLSGGSRLRISRPQIAETPAPQEQAPVTKYCQRHRTELTTGHCQVCQKPICPKCIETFGPFCSPYCRNKIEGVTMDAPTHMGGKFVAQRQYWRKVGLISGSIGSVLAVIFGVWFWYAWFGSQPSVYLRVRWDDISHSGKSWIVDGNQLVFLHGGTLARYNLQTKQKVWSQELVTPQQVADALKAEDAEDTRIQHETGKNPDVMIPRMREKFTRIGLESDLSLHGSGKNIWITTSSGGMDDNSDTGFAPAQMTLIHYDWNTGSVLQRITLTNSLGELSDHGNEMLAISTAPDGAQSVTHISMDDGTMHTEEFSGIPAPASGLAENGPPSGAAPQGGLPLSPSQAGQPMNPSAVAEQAQNMSLPGRIALPALIANSEHNQQILKEAQSEDNQDQPPQRRQRQSRPPAAAQPAPKKSDEPAMDAQNFTMIPDGDNYIAFGSVLIKENIVERDAMRAPPKHSALDNPNVGLANETAAVNEQLNELQRNSGGGTVTEDESIYQIVLRRPGAAGIDWAGQVVGSPQFYALTTVNVLAAGKTIIVFDKTNKKLWQEKLTYDITGGGGEPGSFEPTMQSPYGAGPCVENNGTLYVFDQAVLSAFDPATGNARWRIPSVGVVGLFFGDKGEVYVNTTTGNPDDIKYSREIDVTKSTQAVVMKVDPATGTILWKNNPGGYIAYLSGKYIYSYRYYDPPVDEEDQADEATAALQGTAYLKIIRINPSNGKVMWEHDEGRAPVDVQFDQNMISLVLKKEVEVLKFISW